MRRRSTRGDVSSKRGPNTTGWLGKTEQPIILAKDPTIRKCKNRKASGTKQGDFPMGPRTV
eukprot:245282-Pyramimonas_sp.AAC.1